MLLVPPILHSLGQLSSTHIHTHTHTYMHTHTQIQTLTHTYTNANTNTNTQTQTHTRTHKHTHAHTHTHIHTRAHTQTHTHTHTHTCTHMQTQTHTTYWLTTNRCCGFHQCSTPSDDSAAVATLLAAMPAPFLAAATETTMLLQWPPVAGTPGNLATVLIEYQVSMTCICCNALQRTTTHSSTLQHTLQHTAKHCSTLQNTATHTQVSSDGLECRLV